MLPATWVGCGIMWLALDFCKWWQIFSPQPVTPSILKSPQQLLKHAVKYFLFYSLDKWHAVVIIDQLYLWSMYWAHIDQLQLIYARVSYLILALLLVIDGETAFWSQWTAKDCHTLINDLQNIEWPNCCCYWPMIVWADYLYCKLSTAETNETPPPLRDYPIITSSHTAGVCLRNTCI